MEQELGKDNGWLALSLWHSWRQISVVMANEIRESSLLMSSLPASSS